MLPVLTEKLPASVSFALTVTGLEMSGGRNQKARAMSSVSPTKTVSDNPRRICWSLVFVSPPAVSTSESYWPKGPSIERESDPGPTTSPWVKNTNSSMSR